MSELTELLITPAPQIERVALAIARDAYAGLVERHVLQQLDRLAAPLYRAMVQRSALSDRAACLVDYLFGELELVAADRRTAPPECSYLNQVLERRQGTPLALGVVALALGERVGLPIEGVRIGKRYGVSLGGRTGMILDLSRRGEAVPPAPLEPQREGRHGDQGSVPPGPEPLNARGIALGLLLDLKHAHESRGDHAHALVVCDRLVDLTKAPVHYRDRGVHALALGAPAAAASDLSVYLAEAPDAVDAAGVRRLLRRAAEGKAAPS